MTKRTTSRLPPGFYVLARYDRKSGSRPYENNGRPLECAALPLTTQHKLQAAPLMLDVNSNYTGEDRPPIVAVAPVPAAPVAAVAPVPAAPAAPVPAAPAAPVPAAPAAPVPAAPETGSLGPTGAAQPNVWPASLQPPIVNNVIQQFIMNQPPPFYFNAIPQLPWPGPSPFQGSALDIDCFRQAPWVLQSQPYLGYSTPARALSPSMPTVPIYSPSLPCFPRSPPYPPSIHNCPPNSCSGSRSAPYRLPRPRPREKQAAVAPPLILEPVPPPFQLPPLCDLMVLLAADPAHSAPSSRPLENLPNGSAGGWSVPQPAVAAPTPAFNPSEQSAQACSPDSTLPEVGQAGVNACLVASASTASLASSGVDQQQTTGVHGTAMHAQPRPAARSGPAAGASPAAGSSAYAAHAASAMTSTAGYWRMQDVASTSSTGPAVQPSVGLASLCVLRLTPCFAVSSLAIASPQPAPAGQKAVPQRFLLCNITIQHYLLCSITVQYYPLCNLAAPWQPSQQNVSPSRPLQQQQQQQQQQTMQPKLLMQPIQVIQPIQQMQQMHPMHPAQRVQPNVETSSFEAAAAQVGHNPTSPATSQTESEQQRPAGSTVSTQQRLQYDQNSLQPGRRRVQTDGVTRVAPTSAGDDGAVQLVPESGRDNLSASDALGVSLPALELDVASDSEEPAYEPQHAPSMPRGGSPAR